MEDFLSGLDQVCARHGLVVELIVCGRRVPSVLLPDRAQGRLSLAIVECRVGDQESVIWEGLRQVTSEVVVTLDPDMACNLQDIPRLLELHAAGAALVYASRRRRGGVAPWRILSSWLFNAVVRAVARVPLRDLNTPMTMLSAEARSELLARWSPADPYKILMYRRFAERFHEMPICTTQGRKRGSQYRFADLLRLAWWRLAKIYQVRNAARS